MNVLLLSLLACTGQPPEDSSPPPEDSSPPDNDSSSFDPVVCDPLTLSVSQSWSEEELPDRNNYIQRRPGVGVGDIDGDGDLDILFAYGGGSMALINDGTGLLTEDEGVTSKGRPLSEASAVAMADVDGDGDLDAFLGRQWETADNILINDGAGAFSITTLPESSTSPSGGVFGDLDGDGDLDLVVGRVQESPDPEFIIAGEEHGEGLDLYFNDGSGDFSLDNSSLPTSLETAMVWETELLDVDLDGDLDLYLANDFGPWLTPNLLLLNDGTGHFSVAEDCFCDLGMHAMGVGVGDVNEDGYPDLYVTDIGGPKLLINDGGSLFYNGTLAHGADIPPETSNMSSWGAIFTDIDADMDLDLAVMFGRLGRHSDYVKGLDDDWVDGEEQDDVLLLNDGDQAFTRADEVGFTDSDRGRVVVPADLDGDGHPELITAGKHFLKVWQTEGGCESVLTVVLDAPDHGIGARVSVEAGGRTVTQWMQPGVTASSGAMELYFGLGDLEAADRVEVRWLGGQTTTLQGVAAGERLVVSPE
ncbi:MAG: hypothetical protein ACI8RZ_000608 [Myxococcota bacterium]|jgi:hypothetical protein